MYTSRKVLTVITDWILPMPGPRLRRVQRDLARQHVEGPGGSTTDNPSALGNQSHLHSIMSVSSGSETWKKESNALMKEVKEVIMTAPPKKTKNR